MARNGARLGHSLHLPSPVNHRQLCKRAILAWEQRHGERLSTCRRWLKRHRPRQPVPHLKGGGAIDNIQGLLMKYTLITSTRKVDKREVWTGQQWLDMDTLRSWPKLLLARDAETTTNSPETTTITVLWVRHCFGCHNYKGSDLWAPGQFVYRYYNHTSLCTTDGNHIQTLKERAQQLQNTVQAAFKTSTVTYRYYSSILPRAMMTAKMVQRVIEGNDPLPEHLKNASWLTCLDQVGSDTSHAVPSHASTAESKQQIQRLWYVAEKQNKFEKVPLLKAIVSPVMLVFQLVISILKCMTCQPQREYKAYTDLQRRSRETQQIKIPRYVVSTPTSEQDANSPPGRRQSSITLKEGLNKLSVSDSNKYVEFLNEQFGDNGFSTALPLGDPEKKPTYDSPDLVKWEQKVLPQMLKTKEDGTPVQDIDTVHLIVSHGKTMSAYMDYLAGKPSKRKER